MKIKGNITITILGFFLSLVFLFPMVVAFEHLFEGHNHKPCGESTVHLHQKNNDCSINLFHYNHFSITFESFELLTNAVIPETKNFHYQKHLIVFDKRFLKLRGPPYITV
ncbi:MAG: hypothetical protein CMC74_05115 [Flavobacteriaceae bacterium]|nr:hypothetical protein [Flavobacteriaceae bacterium]